MSDIVRTYMEAASRDNRVIALDKAELASALVAAGDIVAGLDDATFLAHVDGAAVDGLGFDQGLDAALAFKVVSASRMADLRPPPAPRRMLAKWVITERLGGSRILQMDAYFESGTERAALDRERWRAAAHPDVFVDETQMLALLGSVLGLAPAAIDRLLRPYDPRDPDTLTI